LKKHKTPFIITFIRWVFPKLEKISPWLATVYFERIFFTPFRYTATDKEKEFELSATKSTILVDGKNIQAYEWGSQEHPYVIVVHGWAGRATQFRKFVPIFNEAGFRVYGFDGPAHGKSEGKRTTIVEFEHVLKRIVEVKGIPAGIIAHSFGGGASIFAIRNGLPVTKLISIASPTMSDEIIRSYLNAIGGSWPTGVRFKELIQKRYGKPFEEFTASFAIKHILTLELLLIHDTEDRDVSIMQAQEMVKLYSKAKLITTQGLGHNRILKDDVVVANCLDFIKN
jgi:pimeloyl-ACP methyl ester carboxylesterase